MAEQGRGRAALVFYTRIVHLTLQHKQHVQMSTNMYVHIHTCVLYFWNGVVALSSPAKLYLLLRTIAAHIFM